jgi:hypothetical protein
MLVLALVLAVSGVETGAFAQASAECSPACGAGELCVNGVCMVPARPAPTAAVPADAVPPPPAPPPVVPQAAEAPRTAPPPLPITARARPAYAPAAPQPDRVREGALFLPFIGLHSFQDSNDKGVDPGLRVGTFIGGFVNNTLSLNGLAELDILNPNSNGSSAGADVSGQFLGVSFNPLLHVGNGNVEFVIGPKLGGWIEWVHVNINDTVGGVSESLDGTAEGWTLGGNMGLFIPASQSVLVGALLSLEYRDPLHACASSSAGASMCTTSGLDSATILGFTFGVML